MTHNPDTCQLTDDALDDVAALFVGRLSALADKAFEEGLTPPKPAPPAKPAREARAVQPPLMNLISQQAPARPTPTVHDQIDRLRQQRDAHLAEVARIAGEIDRLEDHIRTQRRRAM